MSQLNGHVQEPPRPSPPVELKEIGQKISNSLSTLKNLFTALRKPLSEGTEGGTVIHPKEEPWLVKQIEHDLADLRALGITDLKALIGLQQQVASGQPIDDKKYLVEGLIKVLAKLPLGSENGTKITNSLLTQLWYDLQHPPKSTLGNKYIYRTADGSYNNPLHPALGAANTPYCRTVKPMTMQSGALPAPEAIFDSIMVRDDKNREPHPNRISSVLFYVGSIIIHDIFRTDHENYEMSLTSSYLDLAPLYGSNQDEQNMMRTFKDGKLKPDSFSEKRLLLFPPGVSVLLVMFNRFHNYIVENLALINENGQFTKPTPPTAKDFDNYEKDRAEYQQQLAQITDAEYDNDLFQTGRLITCGLYVNIILVDYIRTILNLNRTDSKWHLDPRGIIGDVPMATGNQCSAEFNLIYRWHAAISERDEKWAEMLFSEIFHNKDPNSISRYEMIAQLKELDKTIDKDPSKRTFARLSRNDKGRFADDDLVKIITESIEDPANSFGARRVPMVMKAMECLGIEQARAWNLATLNEFRKYFGLVPHHTFADINSDPYIAEELENLYSHPDLVELYPGLMAEESKPPILPGNGICLPYTMSRVLLSDAMALVRGDRFHTIDYHPKKLTNWGFSEANFNLDIDNGCVMYKLFLRAFPNHFSQNSIYAHHPMTVPQYMRIALKDLGKEALYNYDRPQRKGTTQMIISYAAVEKVLKDKATFRVNWGREMEFLMGEPAKKFMLAGDGPDNEQSRKMMREALFIPQWEEEVKRFYEKITLELLKEKSYKLAGANEVDIIRDVANLAHVHFCAELFMLPLKTKAHPGVLDEYELYLIMTAVFTCVFFDLDPATSFLVHTKAQEATRTLGQLVEANVEQIRAGGFLSSMLQVTWPHDTTLEHYGKHLIQRLLKSSNMSVKELVWGHIMGTAGGMVPNQGQITSQALEYFLCTPDGQKHLPEINRLAKIKGKGEDDAFDKLMHYLLEGSRLFGESAVFRSVAKDIDIEDGARMLKLKEGDRIMVNIRAASRDSKKFPNPDQLDLNRPLDSYIHFGAGPHQCLGMPMTRVALTMMLKVIGRLDQLRPVEGPRGKVYKVAKPFGETDELPESWHYHTYLTPNWDSYWPFPTSLKVTWDGDIL
ncbi:heme peroxidase [Dendryphion nanum]|uniref:linoleate 8R-lipoxygenase n=1 Tax=Dendryphion nanum TaxID=256645 RepID=A0A9P9DII4_9PLEO|nr:heme peroxidase [Dendryphion nanum]